MDDAARSPSRNAVSAAAFAVSASSRSRRNVSAAARAFVAASSDDAHRANASSKTSRSRAASSRASSSLVSVSAWRIAHSLMSVAKRTRSSRISSRLSSASLSAEARASSAEARASSAEARASSEARSVCSSSATRDSSVAARDSSVAARDASRVALRVASSSAFFSRRSDSRVADSRVATVSENDATRASATSARVFSRARSPSIVSNRARSVSMRHAIRTFARATTRRSAFICASTSASFATVAGSSPNRVAHSANASIAAAQCAMASLDVSTPFPFANAIFPGTFAFRAAIQSRSVPSSASAASPRTAACAYLAPTDAHRSAARRVALGVKGVRFSTVKHAPNISRSTFSAADSRGNVASNASRNADSSGRQKIMSGERRGGPSPARAASRASRARTPGFHARGRRDVVVFPIRSSAAWRGERADAAPWFARVAARRRSAGEAPGANTTGNP